MKLYFILLCSVFCGVPAFAGYVDPGGRIGTGVGMATPVASASHGTGLPLTGTGVTSWGNAARNGLKTAQPDFPRQDADFPRRISFTKIDSGGKELPDSAASWSCVRDNVTGLMWEVKTPDLGLHGKSHTYTWYNPDESANGGVEGTEGEPTDTTCGNPIAVAAGCDTDKFVKAVNGAGWCGSKDWRIPTIEELGSLVNYGNSLPAIDGAYFPDLILPAGFWTATNAASSPNFAWIVIFDDGYLGSCIKSWAYYLRLVRGGLR